MYINIAYNTNTVSQFCKHSQETPVYAKVYHSDWMQKKTFGQNDEDVYI